MKVLIVGASVLQLPAILKAKEMGLTVAVADYNPQAVGIPCADAYYNVSTIDPEGVYQAAKDFGADGIMTLATDMPMRSIAYACKRLGLCGISEETAIASTDKEAMIAAFEKAGVAHPWYVVVESADDPALDKVSFPCICKPTDNSGSRGVVLVEDKKELASAIAYSVGNSRGGRAIVEEYMVGPEVSVEVMVWDGKVYVLQITDKLTTGAPHFVEMGHSQPSRLPAETQEKIRVLAEKAVKAVGIENGPAHVEMMITEDGPKMVELGARMGGDCITSHLVPLSTGIDMTKATIDISLGQTPYLATKHNEGSAIRFFDVPSGEITEISGVEKAKGIPGVKEIVFTKQVGDAVGKIGSSTDRVGYVIAQANTAEEAVVVCQKAMDCIQVSIRNA